MGSWKESILYWPCLPHPGRRSFPPRLTHGLERSLFASVCDQFSVSFSAIYGRGLERSQLMSMLLSTASCTIGWGLEMNVLILLFTADSYPIYMQGLERSIKFCGYLGSLLTVLSADSWSKMTKLSSLLSVLTLFVCKGLERRSWKEPLLLYRRKRLVVSWVLVLSVWGLERNSFHTYQICIKLAGYSEESLKMGSWKELVLCSLCPFHYKGLERGSWKELFWCPFHPLEQLLGSDLLLGHLWRILPSIFVIWVR